MSRLRASIQIGALACSLALSFASCTNHEPTPGPLAPTRQLAGQTGGFRIKAHEPFTFAEAFVRNSGDSPGRIENVELVNATGGIKLVGSLIAVREGEEGPYSPGGYQHYPPNTKFPTSPAEGYRFGVAREGEGLQLLLGFETEPGVQTFQGIAIEYVVNDVQHRYVFPYAVAACSPGELGSPGACTPASLRPWGF